MVRSEYKPGREKSCVNNYFIYFTDDDVYLLMSEHQGEELSIGGLKDVDQILERYEIVNEKILIAFLEEKIRRLEAADRFKMLFKLLVIGSPSRIGYVFNSFPPISICNTK